MLDTNVLASAIVGLGQSGNLLGEILHRWRRDEFQLVTSAFILDELEHTIDKP